MFQMKASSGAPRAPPPARSRAISASPVIASCSRAGPKPGTFFSSASWRSAPGLAAGSIVPRSSPDRRPTSILTESTMICNTINYQVCFWYCFSTVPSLWALMAASTWTMDSV